MLNDATGGAVTARRPSPREEAAYSLHLAAHDPSTDLSVAADVLRDVVAACGTLLREGSEYSDRGWYGWEVSCDRRSPTKVFLCLYGGSPDEPVFGVDFVSVEQVLAFCGRVLLSQDDLDEHVCRVAVEQAFAMAEAAS